MPTSAIHIPEYRMLIAGRFSFIMGLRMLGTLVAWWVYQITKNPFAIGIIGLSEVIPAVGLALYAGHVIDQSEKRKLLLKGCTGYFVCVLALAALANYTALSGQTLPHFEYYIYATVFCTGIIRSFTGPTFHTLVGAIVPKELLPNATAWNQGSWLSASVLGHAVGGFCIALMGIENTLWVIATLVLVGIGFMYQIKPKPIATNALQERKTWDSVVEGLRFVYKTKELLGALVLDLFAVLFGGAVAMIPVFAKDILQVGATGFGWLNAAADVGAIASVAFLALFPLKNKQGKILLLAIAGFGVCIITFGLSTWYWLSFAALLLSGMLDGISVVIRGTILQLYTPAHMRGRVMSVNSMFINSSNELGQFESGVAAKLLGVVPSVVVGGCLTIGVVITTWFKAPNLRNMKY
jgi:MFS family permease